PHRPALLHRRCAVDAGDQRHPGEALRLVRQRMGLCQPHHGGGEAGGRRGGLSWAGFRCAARCTGDCRTGSVLAFPPPCRAPALSPSSPSSAARRLTVMSIMGTTQILGFGTTAYLPAVLAAPMSRDT